MDSYQGQKAKLKAAMEEYKRKVRPDELSATPAAGGAPQAIEAAGAKSAEPVTTQQRPAVSSSTNPITINADIGRGRPIKSVEVNCKVEYT